MIVLVVACPIRCSATNTTPSVKASSVERRVYACVKCREIDGMNARNHRKASQPTGGRSCDGRTETGVVELIDSATLGRRMRPLCHRGGLPGDASRFASLHRRDADLGCPLVPLPASRRHRKTYRRQYVAVAADVDTVLR